MNALQKERKRGEERKKSEQIVVGEREKEFDAVCVDEYNNSGVGDDNDDEGGRWSAE